MPRTNVHPRIAAAFVSALLLAGCGSYAGSRSLSTSPEPVPAAASAKDTAVPAATAGEKIAFDIAFVTHLDMDLPEQDVYIERKPGSGEVFRATKGDRDMSAPLYAVAEEVAHDPFNDDAIGPHAKGAALGMTLGQWLKHRGTGKYTYENGVGHLELEFTGLVPNGVYTMWHAFAAFPPTDPFGGTLDLPLGPRDGTESIFIADGEGNARFDHTFRPGLQMSDTWTKAMLAINFHSDGKTYGGHPGQFGLNAHIPLFVMLPDRAGL